MMTNNVRAVIMVGADLDQSRPVRQFVRTSELLEFDNYITQVQNFWNILTFEGVKLESV